MRVERNGFILNKQYGFSDDKSCVRDLEFYDKVTEVRQEREGWIDCNFLRLKKGFLLSTAQEIGSGKNRR